MFGVALRTAIGHLRARGWQISHDQAVEALRLASGLAARVAERTEET
jgi:hypothetical protein